MMRSTACALAAVIALLAGCEASKRAAPESGMPGPGASFRVDSVRLRVGYLDTHLSSAGITRRIFAPSDDEVCRKMLAEGHSVDWAHSEPFGPLWQGSERCPVVGLGDLEQWRDARGRASMTTEPVTTSRTRYRIVYRDEEYLYAQGGFSLVGLLGWRPGSDQVIALLPRTEVCAPADRSGFSTIEFRITGAPALAVVTPRGLCPISGVVPGANLGPDDPREEDD